MRHYQLVASFLIATALLTFNTNTQAAESSRLITYQNDGQTFYALSLMPELEQKEVDASTIVVLFDTSASQQGAYRAAALQSLQALTDNLRPNDRVEILAVDLGVKPMTKAPVAPGSTELLAGFEALSAQIPLGSTNLAGALEAAATRLEKSNSGQRSVVYIGDGISVANVLDTKVLTNVVGKLREAHVSVSSFAIGPKLDTQLLAVLANQTGGNLYVQEPMIWQNEQAGITDQQAQAGNMRNADAAGKMLAKWTHATVLWPEEVDFASEFGKTYPATMPPLRSDRDTIVIGVTGDQLPETITASIKASGTDLSWTVRPESSQDDHAFLSEIITGAKADDGLSLPTLGSVGLLETARLVGARMDQLTKLAERAISAGDHVAARRIAQSVLQADPSNAQARTVQLVAEQLEAGIPADSGTVVNEAIPATAPQPMVAAAEGEISLVRPAAPVAAGGLLDQVVGGGEFIDQVEQERRVFTEMLRKEVQNSLIDARAQMTSDPKTAIQNLKLSLESIQRVADLDAGKRAELVSKIRSALKEAHYQASMKDELDRQREEDLAASQAQQLINDRLTRTIEREKQLMDRFNALMVERRYIEAQEVVEIAAEIDPEGVTPRVAAHWSRYKRAEHLMAAARAARHQASWEALYQVELSHIPFPDNPPIIYPEASVWEDLTKRRERWKSVDLSASSKAEERIQSALRSNLKTPLDYEAEPLNEILDTIADEYNIPIIIDKAALEVLGVSIDSEVTVKLHNVSLRSALNLMLKEPGLDELTYVIDEEVLLITTQEKADETLKVKVYPVADLVLPVQAPQLIGGGGGGGLGGGGGGGLGGGGGGGFGGGGQGGGGFGGGGGGQGGGGGFFNVADDINADDQQTEQSTKHATSGNQNVSNNAATATVVSTQAMPTTNWQARFANETLAPTVVRQQTRQLMRQKKTAEAIELVQAALQHGQAQSWMYETLGIAMELEGRPKNEIERAIMSACDFAESPAELMLIARYLAHLGLDSRAVEVYQQVVKIAPTNHEAYALGLRAAQRAKNTSGIQWATVGILSNDLPANQKVVTDTARRVAKSILDEMQAANDSEGYQRYYQQLEAALARDVVIKATWSGDADIDLIVEEPGGTTCSLQKPRTTGGGVSLGDDYSNYGKPNTKGYSESYSCAKGFPGTYQVRIRKVWGEVVAGKVSLEVIQNYGTKNQRTVKKHVAVNDDTDAMVVFELEQSRREKPLDVEKLEVAIQRQDAVGQAVLAQQLARTSAASSPRVTAPRRGGQERGGRLRDRLGLARRAGAVGFQPIIQTLPSGTQVSATAVVSADRRYVRITASPSFTGIGDVQTFSFSGSAADTGGGGLGGGLGGGGGGGFGGGGGGGFGGGGGGGI